MILFMVYATALAFLFGLAAGRVEAALRGRGFAGRWAWLASPAASVGVGAWALFRPASAAPPAPGGWSGVPVAILTELGEAVAPPPSVLARADGVAAWVWLVASVVLALALVGGLARLARKARRWTPARVGDALVLLSEDFGPAVLGVRAPRVVLPRWALTLEPERLRMVVLHEEEHRVAGDVGVLLAGCVAVILAPWNPALWWQLHRLRGAVEMDCDARVLRRGVPASLYGRLLLEMGSHDPGVPLPVAALSRPPSLLERRLTMIVRGGTRGSAGRTLGALAVAGVLVAVACEAPMPTAVAPVGTEPSDVAQAKAGAPVVDEGMVKLRAVMEPEDGSKPLLFVDGERVSDLLDLSAEDIERVEVIKGGAAQELWGAEARDGVIQVITKNAPPELLRPEQEVKPRVEGAEPPVKPEGRLRVRALPDNTEIYVDGERFEGDLESIDKETIERVEVVKSPDSRQPSKIYITLKKAGGG